MSQRPIETDPLDQSTATLVAALAEIERHVGTAGWSQPIRLFALVRTDELIRSEPSLAAHLSAGPPDGLSSIEQEDFRVGEDLVGLGKALQQMQWPPAVTGCALTVHRNLVPQRYEADLPQDLAAAAAAVESHPHRDCVRVVVGALRDGTTYGLGRAMNHAELLIDGGPRFAPDLISELQGTLR